MGGMRSTIAVFLALALALSLAGCGGDPTPTTTTMSVPESSQHDNMPVCVGLLIIGSCNTTQSLNQPSATPVTGLSVMLTLMLLCIGFGIIAWFAAALMDDRCVTHDAGYIAGGQER
jgi:hypothetical protein